jgi:sugar lactone lactonase YvrE
MSTTPTRDWIAAIPIKTNQQICQRFACKHRKGSGLMARAPAIALACAAVVFLPLTRSEAQTDHFLMDLATGLAPCLSPNGGQTAIGDGFITVNYWNIPEVVSPGQQVSSQISYTVGENLNPNAVVYKNVLAEWQPNTPIAILENGELQGTARTIEKTFGFTAPTTPGTYRLRLAITWAFAGIQSFYGDGPHGPSSRPGDGPWAEVTIRVAAPAVTDYFLTDLAAGLVPCLSPNGGQTTIGDGSITVNYWNIPEVVAPGQQVTNQISYTVGGNPNPNAVVYKTVLAEWQTNTPIAVLENGGLQGPVGTIEKTFGFAAPTTPGTYRLRLAMTWAFAGIQSFYGDGPHGSGSSPGDGPWAEVTIRVAAPAVTDYFLTDLAAGLVPCLSPNGGQTAIGDGSITVNYWNIPEVVAPGQQVTNQISYTVGGNPNPDAVVYKTVLAEWQTNTPIAVLENGGLQGPVGTIEKTFGFTAPTTPGTYRLRLAMTWAFAGIQGFYGDGPHGSGSSPGDGPWAEVTIRVAETSVPDNLFAANTESQNIKGFTSSGIGSVFAITPAVFPRFLAFDSAGNLYASGDAGNTSGYIYKFDSSGVSTNFPLQHGVPRGLAFDSGGNLYVAFVDKNTIEKFDSSGVSTIFASSGLSQPNGLAFDSAGNLYVANTGSNNIMKFNPSGEPTVFATWGLTQPTFLTFDGNDNLYVANWHSNTIVKFNSSGVGTVFASSELDHPHGLAFDSAGNLYVANNYGNNIVKFNSSGVGTVFASGLNGPEGLIFRPSAPGLDSGLVAHYTLNGNANDATTNGNNGTIVNGLLVADRFGQPQSAYYFNGSTYIVTPHSPSLDNLGNALTLAAWLKIDPGINYSVPDDVHIMSKGATFADLWSDFALQLGNPSNGLWPSPAGSLVFENSNSQNNPIRTNSTVSVPQASWHQVAVTFNSGAITFYLDGAAIGTATSPYQSIRSSTEPLYIGVRYVPEQGFGTYFYGCMDDVRIYNRALSGNEVSQLFIPGYPTLGASFEGTELILSWPTNAASFTLESATNVGPSAVWTPVTPGPAVVNDQFVVTNSISGPRQFFRLRN